jgi:MerR family transcriptional regulator, light-induced transcriptional regulator
MSDWWTACGGCAKLNSLSRTCQGFVQEVTSSFVEQSSSRSRLPPGTGLRIGELSRRVGVTPDVLRAWERRYGVLQPRRSRSGQRLYTAADEARVRQMLGHIEGGYSASVAARLATTPQAPAATAAAPPTAPATDLDALAGELSTALHGLDEAAAESALDRLLASFALDTVIRDVVLPFLEDLGERWARGEISVGREHFATAVIGGRLHALARGWDAGVGPRAVLACPSDERHDLGLLCFALALRGRGWRVCYLGADTPTPAIQDVATELDAELVVVGAARAEPLVGVAEPLAALATSRRLCLGGRGVSAALAAQLGAERLPKDPIAAADLVSAPRNP